MKLDNTNTALDQASRKTRARLDEHAATIRMLAPDGDNAINDLVASIVEQASPPPDSAANPLAMVTDPSAPPDEGRLREAMDRFVPDAARLREGKRDDVDRGLAQALGTDPQSTGDPAVLEAIDIIALPYDHTQTGKSPGAIGEGSPEPTYADHTTGKFGVRMLSVDPTGASCFSAQWMYFWPGSAPLSALQVRPYMPYRYRWKADPRGGSSGTQPAFARSAGRLGLLTLSWDLNGGDRVTEQDLSYGLWDEWAYPGEPAKSSPNWASLDDLQTGYGFQFEHAAPYFAARPNRIYGIGAWCQVHAWGANSGPFFSMGEGLIYCEMPFVVVDRNP